MITIAAATLAALLYAPVSGTEATHRPHYVLATPTTVSVTTEEFLAEPTAPSSYSTREVENATRKASCATRTYPEGPWKKRVHNLHPHFQGPPLDMV